MLEDRYLFKEGATGLMPGLIVYTDPAVWGSDVLGFNYKRFTKGAKPQKESKKPSPTTFRVLEVASHYDQDATLQPRIPTYDGDVHHAL